MKREETVDHHIRATWHAIARMYNKFAGEKGITMSIGFALLNIDSKGGTPATKIAPLMGLEPRSLTRLLKNMEEKGLIKRETDAFDKRSVRIQLTAEGTKKKQYAKEVVIAFNAAVRNKIPPGDLELFFGVLGKINAIVDDRIAG